MSKCACGTPSEANYFVSIILGSDSETFDNYWYLCEEHAPCEDSVAEWWAERSAGVKGLESWRFIEVDQYAHIR